jgi:hypothetical protein
VLPVHSLTFVEKRSTTRVHVLVGRDDGKGLTRYRT